MPRAVLLIIASLLTLVVVVGGTLYFIEPKATLKITTGHHGGTANRFVNALAKATTSEYPRVRLEPVETADLAASAKAIEEAKADLAVIRSDVGAPVNGRTIAILRRDVIAIVAPANAEIEDLSNLGEKTIGIPEGYLQSFNERALDEILNYYDIRAKSVQRLFLPIDEIGRAVAERRIAAVLAVGPMGPGEVVDVVSAVKAATKAPPKVIAIADAKAISKRFPTFESIEVPPGAFRGRPEIPDDSVPTLAVTYRLVAPDSMLDIEAGLIAKTILTTLTKLAPLSSFATQIEAPDLEKRNAVPPVHPGVADYLLHGDSSFYADIENYMYFGGLALSAVGSFAAFLFERLTRRKEHEELSKIDRLVGIADEALRTQDWSELDVLEDELNAIVAWFIKNGSRTETSGFALAVAHARYAVRRQRDLLPERTRSEPHAFVHNTTASP